MGRFNYDSKLIEALERVYGGEVIKFLEGLTKPPTRYYVRVNTMRASVEDVVKGLRSRSIDVYRDEFVDEAIYFPVRGPNEVPTATKYVIADKRASESVMMGSDLYVPGVLGGDFSKGSEVNVVTPCGDVIAYGFAEIDPSDVGKVGKGVAVKVVKSLYEVVKVRELPEFEAGLIYPQSLSSMLVSKLVDPKEGDIIVDMCSAPGGKTGHLVELTGGKAVIYAFDHSKTKVDAMMEELGRLGHLNFVKVLRADSRYLHIDYSWIRADKVLVDPPCSALGVIPKISDSKKYEDVKILSNYQIQFLRAAAKVAKEGAIISYSTCTVTLEENEEVVGKAVEELGLEVVEPSIKLGSRGITDRYWGKHLIRFHPHIHGCPGYFIALLRRR